MPQFNGLKIISREKQKRGKNFLRFFLLNQKSCPNKAIGKGIRWTGKWVNDRVNRVGRR